jgi:hypothetical protein
MRPAIESCFRRYIHHLSEPRFSRDVTEADSLATVTRLNFNFRIEYNFTGFYSLNG